MLPRLLLSTALLALLAIGAAPATAAMDETDVARSLPDPDVSIGAPEIEDGRLGVCVSVRWSRVPGRALEGRDRDEVRSIGTVRLFAFTADRSGSEQIASAQRRDRVALEGERERYCFRLDRQATKRLTADGATTAKELRARLFADAVQMVDADRDGGADALGADSAGRDALGAKAPCDMSGMSAVTALQTCANWVVLPSPDLNDNASPSVISSQLRFLADQGFRGVVTYTVAGNMHQVPQLARKAGFQKVLVGLWEPGSEIGRVGPIAAQIDGVVVGNEGVGRRYSIDQLEGWVRQLKSAHPKLAITTTNEWIWYLPSHNADIARRLMRLGDFLFPNLHAFWDNNPASNGLFSANPNLGAQFTKVNLDQWFLNRDANPLGLPVIIKEAWWPDQLTANPQCALQPNPAPAAPPPPSGPEWQAWNGAPYSEAAQTQFFRALRARGIRFIWGEPFDMPGKHECKVPPPAGYGGDVGPHWGLWRSPGQAKQVVAAINFGRY